jgi:hypothetical protein
MNLSPRTKLIIGFLLIAILPLLFVSILNYSIFKRTLLEQQIVGLEAIAEAKISTIKNYADHFRKELVLLQDNAAVREGLITLSVYQGKSDNSATLAAKRKFDEQFGAVYQKRNDIVDVMLVSINGTILYTSNLEHRDEDVGSLLPDPDGQTFDIGKEGVYVSDIFLNKVEDNSPYMLAAAPVLDFEKKLVGLVVLEIDARELYAIVQDTTGLGKTGETLLGELFAKDGKRKMDSLPQLGDYVVFINPLRFDSDAAFVQKEIFSNEPLRPLQLAVSGKNGFGISQDYRGKEVLAVWRYIPSLNWGLVTKIDYSEVVFPIKILLIEFVLIITASLIFVFIYAWYASGIVARAVKALDDARKQAAERFEEAKRLNDVMVDRELKMVELKEELKKYKNNS